MKIISELRKKMYLPLLIIIFLIIAFFVNSPMEILKGYYNILISPSILITDYLEISNLGATLFNVSTIMIFNLVFIKAFDLRISGPVFSGFMIIAGFSFFGKNIFNTIPIYFGIYIYSRMKKIPYKNLILSILFSTGISPLVSYCMFGFGFPLYYGIPLGIICGMAAGFLIPAFASHTIKFHLGYNLFNTGFALGLISVLFYALFTAFGLKVETANIISTKYHLILLILIICISVLSIAAALINDYRCFIKYREMLKRSGRLVSDYIRDFGREAVMLNVGFIGILCAIIILAFGIKLNGPVFGTIITIMGFGAYGLHIKNMIPVILGGLLAIFAKQGSFSDVSTVVALFFVTGLSPLAGRYGLVVGMVAGFLHIIVAPLMISFQGGFDLYNNGFVAGFISSIVVVMCEAFSKGGE